LDSTEEWIIVTAELNLELGVNTAEREEMVEKSVDREESVAFSAEEGLNGSQSRACAG
jgi:hypothetical protein